jgi:hypothetical protein
LKGSSEVRWSTNIAVKADKPIYHSKYYPWQTNFYFFNPVSTIHAKPTVFFYFCRISTQIVMRSLFFLICPILFFLSFPGHLDAQGRLDLPENIRGNDGNMVQYRLSYGYQRPGGDLANRFGDGSYIPNEVEFMTASNWFVGLGFGLGFGNRVIPDVLANLRSPDGYIYANDGIPADIVLRQRLWLAEVYAGKLIPVLRKNQRSGIRIALGGGLLQHKIRVQDDPQAVVPQVEGDYKQGYDRLTNGFALHQFIGYQHLGLNRRINFFAGVDLIQGFTQGRRDWDFATQQVLDEPRLDLLYAFRVGWILPFYTGENPDQIYY